MLISMEQAHLVMIKMLKLVLHRLEYKNQFFKNKHHLQFLFDGILQKMMEVVQYYPMHFTEMTEQMVQSLLQLMSPLFQTNLICSSILCHLRLWKEKSFEFSLKQVTNLVLQNL